MTLPPIKFIAPALCAALLLVGCSGASASAESDAPVVASPTTSTSTTLVVDPYVIPDVITPEYVDAVVQELNVVFSDMRRDVVDTHEFSTLSKQRIEAIFDGQTQEGHLDIWSDVSMESPITVELPHPGRPTMKLIEVPIASNECIYARYEVNDNANIIKPLGSEVATIVLHPSISHKRSINPTPWRYYAWIGESRDQGWSKCAA